MSMNELREIIFEVHEADEGGFWAKAVGLDIFTQGDDWEELKTMAKDAVNCWFDNSPDKPQLIRLHLVKDEVVAA